MGNKGGIEKVIICLLYLKLLKKDKLNWYQFDPFIVLFTCLFNTHHIMPRNTWALVSQPCLACMLSCVCSLAHSLVMWRSTVHSRCSHRCSLPRRRSFESLPQTPASQVSVNPSPLHLVTDCRNINNSMTAPKHRGVKRQLYQRQRHYIMSVVNDQVM